MSGAFRILALCLILVASADAATDGVNLTKEVDLLEPLEEFGLDTSTTRLDNNEPHGEDELGLDNNEPHGEDVLGSDNKEPHGEDLLGLDNNEPHGEDVLGSDNKEPYGEDVLGATFRSKGARREGSTANPVDVQEDLDFLSILDEHAGERGNSVEDAGLVMHLEEAWASVSPGLGSAVTVFASSVFLVSLIVYFVVKIKEKKEDSDRDDQVTGPITHPGSDLSSVACDSDSNDDAGVGTSEQNSDASINTQGTRAGESDSSQ